MLDAIRKYSTSIVVKILFLLLVVSFVIWGIADVFRPGQGGAWLARVGDTQISAQLFRHEYDNALRRLGQALGTPIDREQARALGLADNVLNTLIDRALLDKGAADLGVTITDDLVRAQITGDPRFRGPSGQFDKTVFEQTLSRNGLNEPAYVALLRSELARQQLIGSVVAGASVPTTLVDWVHRFQGEKRVAEYVVVADAVGGRPPAPSEDQLRQFHAENPKRFTAPEFRQATVVVLTLEDFARGLTVGDDEVRKAYADAGAKLGQPERRAFRQIVFSDEAAARAAYDRITTGGASFDAVAREAGNDPAGLGLGPLARQQLPGELANAVFGASPGTVVAPVRSPLGWHVIEVTRIEAATIPSFEQLRDRLANDIRKEKAVDLLIEAGNKLEAALAKGATLEEAAREQGLSAQAMPAIDASGQGETGKPIAGLPARFAEAIFATEEGRETGLVEASSEVVFLARVDKIIPPSPRPFEEAQADARAAWTTEQQKKQAQALAEAIAAEARAGKPLATVATARGLKASTTTPFARSGEDRGTLPVELVNASFASAPNEVTLVRSGDGFLVARVVKVETPPFDPAAPDTAALREDLTQDLRQDWLAQLIGGLRQRYPVTINRQLLDQQL